MSTAQTSAAGRAKLSAKQRELLDTLTPEFTAFKRRHGMPFMVVNPTVDALRKRGFIEIATVPPRWRITDAGRAALTQGLESKR